LLRKFEEEYQSKQENQENLENIDSTIDLTQTSNVLCNKQNNDKELQVQVCEIQNVDEQFNNGNMLYVVKWEDVVGLDLAFLECIKDKMPDRPDPSDDFFISDDFANALFK
jgi:hypothetical protein